MRGFTYVSTTVEGAKGDKDRGVSYVCARPMLCTTQVTLHTTHPDTLATDRARTAASTGDRMLRWVPIIFNVFVCVLMFLGKQS